MAGGASADGMAGQILAVSGASLILVWQRRHKK